MHVNVLKKKFLEEVNRSNYRTLLREHSLLLTDYVQDLV